MKKTSLPLGMHDKLFKRAKVMYQLERDISDLLMDLGFNRIETPTLEHFEVFSDDLSLDHYHLFDKQGNLLSLRPDMTSQIGRVVASTRINVPVRFSYSGKVFNYNEEMRGLSNEHTQAGVEIVGYDSQKALHVALTSAKKALDVAGLKQYHFELSHAAILQSILQELALTPALEKDLLGLIQAKNITGLTMFTMRYPSEFDAFICQLPYLFGESESVLAKARQLTNHAKIMQALDSLEMAVSIFADNPLMLDLAQVPTMPYYTGMMFKVFGDKVPDAFVSGGRYDRLFERFGAKQLTAVGWALDIDSVYQAIHSDIAFEEIL